MGKIINTLKYGDKATKSKLYMLFGILAAALVVFVTALAANSVALGVISFAALVIDGLILLDTSFATRQLFDEEPEKDGNRLKRYNQKSLKRVMVAYKVKREHVLVMVEQCSSEKVVHCPAYAWKDRQYLYFLLLDTEPKMVKAKLEELEAITIRRGIPANPSMEYEDMKEQTFIGKLFEPYLPNYYQKQGERKMELRKNMYAPAKGIWCTATSVKNLLKLLPERFAMEETTLTGDNDYFKEVYVSRVLYYDGIYSAAEHREKVRSVLMQLAEAEIASETFHFYLAQMVMKGLIPQEYADYAINKRAKKSQK